jgi:MoxR-like ATPase
MNNALFDLDNYKPVPVVYQMRAAILKRIRQNKDIFPDIQGRQEAKKDVARALLSGYNIYLVSEEGTGKTRISKSLTKLLGTVPKIKGCPYNDDPKWPKRLLCPRCKTSKDPVIEYGIELMTPDMRFSRIQGNEYTDEGKLFGMKDIHSIATGKSPTDMESFAATGIFRANRGILFVDELPAIRTKVQVLLHPVAEEKKAVLEEYNIEHPLDIILIATGNPQGFSHVNEVPRPLLDRMELIYMPTPGKEIEIEIALCEKFKTTHMDYELKKQEEIGISSFTKEDIKRTVVLPWWIMHLINEAIDCSRKCDAIDKKPSIRGSYRAFDHTYASAELENRDVAYFKDAADGLTLALRGRVELKPDLIDFDSPEKNFKQLDVFVADILCVAVKNLSHILLDECNVIELAADLKSLTRCGIKEIVSQLEKHTELKKAVKQMVIVAGEKIDMSLLSETERELFSNPESANANVYGQYIYSAVEMIYNAAIHMGMISYGDVEKSIYTPVLAPWSGIQLNMATQ